jgi:hypothetical protein
MISTQALGVRIGIFVIFILLACGGFLYFKTPGYEKSRLYHAKCYDVFDKTKVGNLIRCEIDRHRLDFGTLAEENPDVGARVVMIRDRVRELQALSEQTANWALNWHLGFVAMAIVLLAGVALFPLKEADQSQPQHTVAAWFGRLAPSLTAVTVLLIAIGQSVAFHTKYKAGFTAAQQWQALAVVIDAELIEFMSGIDSNELSKEEDDKLSELVLLWAEKLIEIQSEFAETYGSSFALINAP